MNIQDAPHQLTDQHKNMITNKQAAAPAIKPTRFELPSGRPKSMARHALDYATKDFKYDTMHLLCDYETLVRTIKEHIDKEREWPLTCCIELFVLSNRSILSTFYPCDVSENLNSAIGIHIYPDHILIYDRRDKTQ